MSEVKWIKITTDIFDDEKILLIESLPSADSVIVIWFKLLVLAGKQNNNGIFMLNDRIAITDEMLATIFRRDVNTVRMALKVFVDFGMIDVVDNVVTIPNWNKHQSLDALERKKKRDRAYQAARRLKQKQLVDDCVKNRLMSDDVSDDLSDDLSSEVAPLDIDIERDIDIDKDIKKKYKKEKPPRHKYGEYNNVLLSDKDMEKLKSEFPSDWQERIDTLSYYMKSKNKSYTDHLATIRAWARKERKQAEAAKPKDDFADMMLGTYL